MQTHIKRVEAAIAELKKGKMIILTDDEQRENEGDLILPAENITEEKMNFIIRNTSGIVCLSMTSAQLKQLDLPLMLPSHENTSARGTPFTISIDAKNGITTGVSAADRTKTILTVIQDDVHPNDLVKPGHIFPLQARDNGVLERDGHTEGALDIVRLAGFKSAAVLCEIMDTNGTMMRGEKLKEFAKEHHLLTLSIADIIAYRLTQENLIIEETSAFLPIENYGHFKMTVVREKITNMEHVVLINDAISLSEPTLVRIHSSCTTGDIFSSQRCDCHDELHYSLKKISQEGGMLIYLNQEGRGIGLFNKIKAYSLQEQGHDTVEANELLGLPVDARKYYIAANILRNYHIEHIRLLTNNPQKIQALIDYGIKKVEQENLPTFHNEFNQHYLQTKKDKLNHTINL